MQHYFLVLTTLCLCAGAAFARDVSGVEEAQFTSGNTPIRVDWYRSTQAGNSPVVLLLHGADGMRQSPELYPRYAQLLASHGYHVMIVHYFDRTATRTAGLQVMLQNFGVWTSTVTDAIDWAARQPGVDSQRIGLLGISLGSSLALTVGTQDPRVKCVVEFFGMLPPMVNALASRVPPVLVLHGDQDPIVPVSAAYELEKFLTARKADFEVKIYPGQGHGFHGAAQLDAGERALTFFTHHLGGAVS